MDDDAKIGQLFCLVVRRGEPSEIDEILKVVRPNGLMLRPQPAKRIPEVHRYAQERSEIPLLLSANLETGGVGTASDATLFASPLQVAATDDATHAYRLGLVAGREARALGCNWTFSPDIDLDLSFHNPITNTRTFGSAPDRVLRMAKAYMKGIQECGPAVMAKHWPGDGVDGRDQHLLTSVNSLSVREWDRGFGKVHKGMIDAGVNAVMSAHIMLPVYSRKLRPAIRDQELMPASLAKELLQDLPRRQGVPGAIAAGNDIFLFSISLAENVDCMKEGLRSGLLSRERLDEAVTRVPALKASLKPRQRKREGTLAPAESALSVLHAAEHHAWAAECADKSVTLVKDAQELLPLRLEKHKRILLFVLGDVGGYLDTGRVLRQRQDGQQPDGSPPDLGPAHGLGRPALRARHPDAGGLGRQPLPPPGRADGEDLRQRLHAERRGGERRGRQAARPLALPGQEPHRSFLRVLGGEALSSPLAIPRN